MGQPIIGSLNLDTTSQGSVKRSSNLSGGQKFANALDEGADAVGGIADNIASVFPGGGAVLSAVASGLSNVTGSGPMGGSMGGIGGMGGGGGFAGAMGGGGSIGGSFGNSIQGPMGNVSLAGMGKNPSPLQMLKLQQQLQNQSQMVTMISAIINMEHQTASSIIQNIH
ncbi:MAG: hypothetical protein WCK49_05330 [Myxococcaceae bacterium]